MGVKSPSNETNVAAFRKPNVTQQEILCSSSNTLHMLNSQYRETDTQQLGVRRSISVFENLRQVSKEFCASLVRERHKAQVSKDSF